MPHPPDIMPPLPPPTKFAFPTSNTPASLRRANQRMGRATNSEFGDVINPPLSGDNRAACEVATTVAGTLATDFEPGDTVDGVVLVQFMRILIKNQVSAIENGIYVVMMSGAPQRAQDLAPGAHAKGVFCFVLSGTQSGQVWRCTSPSGSDVVDTDNLTWGQFTPSGGGGVTPTFHGTRVNNTSTSITPAPATLTWTGVDYDTDSWFNGTNTITVGTTGYYLIQLHLLTNWVSGAATADQVSAIIKQSGVQIADAIDLYVSAASSFLTVTISTVIKCSAGDTLIVQAVSGANTFGANSIYSFFDVSLLGT